MKINYFVTDVFARGTDGHINAEDLPKVIAEHDGREAYHCAFELEKESLKVEIATDKIDAKGKQVFAYVPQSAEHVAPLSFNKYAGVARGTLGYAWFDFDSSDGGETALADVRSFAERIGHPLHVKYYYSGSKGFHVAIPMGYFNLQASKKLPAILNHVATSLKRSFYKSLDTTVFNAQRKFRALGTKHSKTGLYKIELTNEQLKTLTIAQMRELASIRGSIVISEAPFVQPVAWLMELAATFDTNEHDSLTLKEWARYKKTNGERAFVECDFLKHCKENAKTLSEPEWYAAASIVGRFENGRAQFHVMSKPHKDYSTQSCDDKLDQSLGSAGPRTCKGIQALWGRCFSCKHFEKIKSPVVILDKDVIPTEATGFYFIEKDSKGVEKRTPDFNGLVQAFKRDLKYIVDANSELIYAWTGSHYQVMSKLEVKAWCEQVMHPAPTGKIADEFYGKVLRNFVLGREKTEHLFFNTVKEKLNCKNGVLDLVERVVTPHDEAIGFRYVLPYEYDPEAKCPTFDKFLNDVTLGRVELQKTLLEFMGYALHAGYEDHCFLWLAGSGRNGKSTFLDLLRDLVGTDATQSVMLINFEKSFSLQSMDGMLLNISEESDSQRLRPVVLGNLKGLSSGAAMQVEKKNGHPYTMRPTAKLAFAANKPPLFSGTEDALKSRMIVVPFDLKLEEHGADGTDSRIDFKLKEKLRDELPGILNRVLAALSDFVCRTPRKIYRSSVSHHAMNEIMRDSDTLEAWVQECTKNVQISDAVYSKVNELYLHFKEETEDEFYTLPTFGKNLRQKMGSKVKFARIRDGGKRVSVVHGLVLRDDVLETPDF